MSKAFSIICPNCGEYMSIPLAYMGETGECPYCDQEIELNALPKNLQKMQSLWSAAAV